MKWNEILTIKSPQFAFIPRACLRNRTKMRFQDELPTITVMAKVWK